MTEWAAFVGRGRSPIKIKKREEEEETRNLLSRTKGRYGWFPIPTPQIQTRCYRCSATINDTIINMVIICAKSAKLR